MRAERINHISRLAMIVVAIMALLMVFSGFFQPPAPDEGAAAHIFQISIVLLVPAILLFLATADWTQPLRRVRMLSLPAAIVVIAFVTLYYLEHVFYPAHYH